jgi:hypothetical protein
MSGVVAAYFSGWPDELASPYFHAWSLPTTSPCLSQSLDSAWLDLDSLLHACNPGYLVLPV